MDSLLALSSSDDGWKFVETKNGVDIHKKEVEGSAIVMYVC